MLADPSCARPGWKVCACCKRLKRFSEFVPKRKARALASQMNKTCDSCITRQVISNRESIRRGGVVFRSFSDAFWRARAYTLNNANRQRVARKSKVDVASIDIQTLPDVVKPQELAGIYAAQSGLCHYCDAELKIDNMSFDHAQPSSRGGSNGADNLRATCKDCNYMKHTKTESEFQSGLLDFAHRVIRKVAEQADKEPLG